jgi:hypothetical protein
MGPVPPCPPGARRRGPPRQHEGRPGAPGSIGSISRTCCCRCAARSAVLVPRSGCGWGCVGGGEDVPSASLGGRTTTTWWGATYHLTCDDAARVVHRVGVAVAGVQGVLRGPPPPGVTALPGRQALGEGAVPTLLGLGGQAHQPQPRAGPGDGAPAEPGGRGEPRWPAGDPQQRARAPAGAVVRGVGVRSGHRQHRPQRHTPAGEGNQLRAAQQVPTSVHRGDVHQPPIGRPPARQRRPAERLHGGAGQGPAPRRHNRGGGITPTQRSCA